MHFTSAYLAGAALCLALRGQGVSALPWGSEHPDHKCLINKHPNMSDLAGVDYLHHVHAARLPSGNTYRYVHYRPRPGKPTVLFLHGFPSSSFDWRKQFPYFSARGFGVLAPDLLGYGNGTDQPADVEAYTLKKQARDVVDLLACVGAGTAVGVGHDLGSPVLSRVATYHPDRLAKYGFLDVGYEAPGMGLSAANLAVLSKQSLAERGFDPWGYWMFFNETGAGKVLDAHQDSIFSISYTNAGPEYWPRDFGPPGALEAFLKANKRAPTGPWVTPEDETIHNRIFAPERGGYEPVLNNYRALYRDLNAADEAAVPASGKNVTKPVLLITALNDVIATPELAVTGTQPYAPDLTIKAINGSHFLMLEKPDEVNQAFGDFFDAV